MVAGVRASRIARNPIMRMLLLCLCMCFLVVGANARAAACGGPFAVGFRTLQLADGRNVSVWYPLPAASQGPNEETARACPRWPLAEGPVALAGAPTFHGG